MSALVLLLGSGCWLDGSPCTSSSNKVLEACEAFSLLGGGMLVRFLGVGIDEEEDEELDGEPPLPWPLVPVIGEIDGDAPLPWPLFERPLVPGTGEMVLSLIGDSLPVPTVPRAPRPRPLTLAIG